MGSRRCHRWPVRSRSAQSEAGSVALLAPAAVLVLVVLGAIAVDLALVQTAQRRLVDLAGSIATDAAGQVDVDAALGTGHLVVDRGAAQGHADRSAAAVNATDARLQAVRCSVEIGDGEVAVTCRGEVAAVLGYAIPGTPTIRGVTARDVARGLG